MRGRLHIVGLGPGDEGLMTPRAAGALAAATDIVGYGPYVERVAARDGQRRHASDNREEIDRARHALSLAAAGRHVAVVSSGDAGVFAMAVGLAALYWLHPHLDHMFIPDELRILNRPSFRFWHRTYLWVSTVQWAFAVLFAVLSLAAWRAEDRLSPSPLAGEGRGGG